MGGLDATAQPANDSETHTLEIISTNKSNESISYSATASNNLSLENGENSDYTVRGSRVAGTVGGNDNKDVIHYAGYIESFEFQNNNVKLRLDGRQISPKVLAGNHIEIIHPTNASGETVSYNYPIVGTAERGERAEDNDTANDTIEGSIDSGSDSFYFVGEIPESAFQEVAEVRINGQPAEKFLENPPPTSTETTNPTTTTVPSDSSPTTASNTAPPHQETNTQPQDSESGSNSSGNTFLIGFAAGIILLIGGGIAGLFYLDRQ